MGFGVSEDEASNNTTDEILKVLDDVKEAYRNRLIAYDYGYDEPEIDDLQYDIDDTLDSIDSLLTEAYDSENNFIIINQGTIKRKLNKILNIFGYSDKLPNSRENLIEVLNSFFDAIREIEIYIESNLNFIKINKIHEEVVSKESQISKNVESSNTLINYLRQAESYKIYDVEARKFKKTARAYEFVFYFLIFCMFIYFSGITFYISDFNLFFVDLGFPPKIESNNIYFYIQKVSILILSSTLAAFLLKRSFMNRELYQEAYRISKELNALPSYIESFSKEIQDKIRLDLAYKYFGRESAKNSNNDMSNLVADQMKTTTELVKVTTDAIKALSKGQL